MSNKTYFVVLLEKAGLLKKALPFCLLKNVFFEVFSKRDQKRLDRFFFFVIVGIRPGKGYLKTPTVPVPGRT